MFNIFKKNKNVVVLKKTKPGACGGTDATQDTSAPKKIESTEMIYFSAETALTTVVRQPEDRGKLVYINAYAAPCGEGTFMYIDKRDRRTFREGGARRWAYVKKDVFPDLVGIVNEYGLANENGFHSRTHGLPENFGGSIDIRYKSGETISVSDNQSPVMRTEAVDRIAQYFDTAMSGENIPLPSVDSVVEIRYGETRKNGGYKKAALTLDGDKGTVRKECRYDSPDIFKSEKELGAEAIKKIKDTIEKNGVFAWARLPKREYGFSNDEKLTFVFEDGGEITVYKYTDLPYDLSGAFFDISFQLD